MKPKQATLFPHEDASPGYAAFKRVRASLAPTTETLQPEQFKDVYQRPTLGAHRRNQQ